VSQYAISKGSGSRYTPASQTIVDENTSDAISSQQELRVYLLGPFAIEQANGRPLNLDALLARNQSSILFKLLLCHPERRIIREPLIDALWPGQPYSTMEGSLGVAKSILKTRLETICGQPIMPRVSGDPPSYSLVGQTVIWTDVDACEQFIRQAINTKSTQKALSLWEAAYALLQRGTLLADDLAAYWYQSSLVQERRKRLARQRTQCVLRIADLALEREDSDRAVSVLGEESEADPANEEIALHLMELLARHERYMEALQCYARLEAALLEQDAEPRNATRALVQQIRSMVTTKVSLERHTVFIPLQAESQIEGEREAGGASPGSELSIPQQAPSLWTVSYPLNPFFTGRQELLTSVLGQLQQHMQAAPLTDAGSIGDNEAFSSILDMVEHMMNRQGKASGISRRQALTVLLGASGTALCIPAAPSFLPAAEEIVAFCAANIAACWQLGRGSRHDMLVAHALVASYLPTLASLAQQPSPHQKSAADQAAIGYRLQAILSYHVESLAVADENAKLAVFYSRIAEDANILVSSLVQRAMIAYYAHRREEAVAFCGEASLYLNQVTSRVRSYVYRVQAACLAQLGQGAEALASLDLAYEHFYHPSHHEASSLHVAGEEFELFLWDGITRSHLVDQGDAAILLLKKADPLENPALPERVRTGFLNNLVFAMLRMPAQHREMEECMSIWTEAITRARELGSELRYQEALRAYDEMLVAFPHEQSIMQLRKLTRTRDHQQ
jgi:DNA-binding SARP family transcriptional activator